MGRIPPFNREINFENYYCSLNGRYYLLAGSFS